VDPIADIDNDGDQDVFEKWVGVEADHYRSVLLKTRQQ
jgi:hypothetical protein